MRDALRAVVVAALAVPAVAIAAATLNSTVTREPAGPEGPGAGNGTGKGGYAPTPSGGSPGEALQIPFLEEILVLLAVVVALAVLAYLFLYWRDVLRVLALLAVGVAVLYLLSQFLSPPAEVGAPSFPEQFNASPAGGGGGGGDEARPSPLPLLALVVLCLVAIGSLAAVVGGSRSLDQTSHKDAEATRDVDTAALGRAAGRAADNLEAADEVENEVYRAWREMTRLLDVDSPETSTPDEFAGAAVAAGLDREAVEELTWLFQTVRYGDADPNEETERRAVETFRQIEAAHAETEGEP